MKKILTLLCLALLIALPGCRKDKSNKKDDRRTKTTKQDNKAKNAPAKKGAVKKSAY